MRESSVFWLQLNSCLFHNKVFAEPWHPLKSVSVGILAFTVVVRSLPCSSRKVGFYFLFLLCCYQKKKTFSWSPLRCFHMYTPVQVVNSTEWTWFEKTSMCLRQVWQLTYQVKQPAMRAKGLNGAKCRDLQNDNLIQSDWVMECVLQTSFHLL